VLTSSGYGAISSVAPTKKTYRANIERENRAQANLCHNNYDSVALSAVSTKESRFHMEAVSRLAQEVRTATTTGDIQTLKQQVALGQYTPDPMAIAARILFLGEGE